MVFTSQGKIAVLTFQTKIVAHLRQKCCCNRMVCATVAVVGFTNGTVRVLDALTLQDETAEPFHYARDAITQIVFSHVCRFFATAVSPLHCS